jgi:hypothetical protein
MALICIMDGVREYAEGDPVELHIDRGTGRLVVVATNEAGYASTSVDLNDLLEWLKHGPASAGSVQIAPRSDP